MFCPNCGAEEHNRVQFCRACGAELHLIRAALEQPDTITASAVNAREEIARAIADKIMEFKSTNSLRRAVEDILPAIDKYLQSPEERRMRDEEKRLELIRGGFITSAVGFSLILFFMLLSWVTQSREVLIGGGAGGIVFFIGLGVLLSGMLFKPAPQQFSHSNRNTKQLAASKAPAISQQKMNTAPQPSGLPSVTEGTTRQLRD